MLLLTDDPLTLSQSKIEQFELKLTFDVQFLLEVEFNFNSPKIQIAMQNLNFKEQDLIQKKYSKFQIQDEDNYVTEQRYLIHLHQIAHKRKLLVKERNKIKKEEAETLKYDQSMNTRYYSQTESFNYINIDNAISILDKRIELQQIKKDKTQLILKNKIREQIEEELKILNENKVQEQENLRIKKLRKKNLKAISDRAHSFNQKTQQIAKKHQESIQFEQEKAFERKNEILQKDKLVLDDSERGLYQNQIKQKEKELKELLKQKQVNDRIKQIKQQEIEQCNQLYSKIQSKLNKSQINRLSLQDNNRTSVLQITQSHQKVEETQKFLEKYIQKQTRYINNSKESQRQLIKLKKRKNIKQQFNQEKQTNYTKIEESYPEKKTSKYSPQLNKKNKSRSLVNLEKINLQQLEKVNKVLEKQRSSSIIQSQIRERKEILREASKSNFQQRNQFQELQNDLSKIKNNVSKEFLFKQISKWDCLDLINKYYK